MHKQDNVLDLGDLAHVTAEFARLCSTAQRLADTDGVGVAAALLQHGQHAMDQAQRLADVEMKLMQYQHPPSRWTV